MTYDEIGNMLSVRDGRDLASHVFTYDDRNRVETYTDPLGQVESYDYDGMGNLLSSTDRKGQVTSYTYDALDRVRTITYADSSIITVVWDAGNRARQIIDTANGTIMRDYDALDRLTREVTPQGQVDYEYDDAGRRTQLTVAGQAPITYDYDDASRLTRIAQGNVTIDLTYDASNRRATVTWPNGVVGTYGFDDADQLLSIVYDKGVSRIGEVGYTYDLAGRRVGQSGSLAKLTMPVTMNAATYDDANRLTNWAGQSLTYDDNGNLTSRGAISYGWNARDELISTSSGLSSFAYDALGRRRSRAVAGSAVSYLHDGMNPVLVNNELMLSGFSLDEFYARVSGGAVTSLLPDALGSTRLLTDDAGSATANYAYSPYGAASRSGSSDTPFQFTGRENDGASGLYYYRARYYDAGVGRFISEDPIRLEGGINTYAYALGKPTEGTDPLGLVTIVAGGNIRLPTLLIRLLFPDYLGSGGSAGFALQLTKCGEFAPDMGVYWSANAGGVDAGTGRAAANLGFQMGGIGDLAGAGGEGSLHVGRHGATISVDKEGGINGASFDYGWGYNAGYNATITGSWSARDGFNSPNQEPADQCGCR
jgi:RHS repeat-associated protein